MSDIYDRIEKAIAYAFEGEGEAWSDHLSGDRLARVARNAIEEAGLILAEATSLLKLPTEPGTVIEVMSTTRQEIDVTPWFLTSNQEWEPIGHYAASIEGGLRLTDITSYRTVSMPA